MNSKLIDPQFLAYWFTFQWQERIFERLSTQWVNQAAVRKEDLLALKLYIPTLSEQRRIAAILQKADRLRRLRRYARQLSDTYLQSVFLEMFGDPERNTRGWDKAFINDVVKASQYGTSKKSNNEHKGYPILGMANITYLGEIDLSTLSYVDLSEQEFQELQLEKGDIIFNRTNSTELVGKTAHWTAQQDAVLASYLVKIKLNHKITSDFFAALLNSNYFKKMFQERCKKAVGQSNISPTLLREFPIYLPPIDLQKKFSEILYFVRTTKVKQTEANRQAEHLFQSLLRRAFQGEL